MTTSRPEQLRVRRAPSSWLLWLGLAVVVVALAGWYATHPNPLPTEDTPVLAQTPVGEPVYVGVLMPDAESDRTLHIRGIDVDPEGELPVSVVGLVCQGGAVAVTSDPETFCSDLVDAEGASVSPGDVLVLRIVGELAGEVELGRVQVSYREGLQWGTDDAGPPVTASFLSR